MSWTAEIIYSLLLYRAQLSKKNRWIDSEGRIYIQFSNASLAKALHKCEASVRNALRELEKAGLIEKRSNAGSANTILDKRFMLEIINGEPKTYVTTSVDQSTERYELHGKTQGFLVLNIRQDQYNSKTDNAEKMICDYFEPNKSDKPDADSQVTATIKYAGKPEVRVGGSWKKFTPVFTSITGEEVAEVAKWSFICIDEFKSFVETQVATDGVFKIRILNNSIMDGATVKISLTNADDTANTSIECKVVSLL